MYPPFNMFGQNNQNGNNPFAMMQNFNNFRQTFQGDPRRQVQDLLNSGRMSQEQFNKLSSMAYMFQMFIK